MAVTATINNYMTAGSKRSREVTVTLSSSYTTGGDPYTERTFGLLAVNAIHKNDPAAYKVVPDLSAKTFLVYQQLPTGLTQVPSGVDLSAITFKAQVLGY